MGRRRMQPIRYVPSALLVNAFAAIVLAIMALLGPAPARAAAPVHILALGDSLTAGYGLPAREAFPAVLQAVLKAKGENVTVVNAGVSGDTSAGGRARIGWALGGTTRPDAVIVELGANDGLRGLEPKEMRANLAAILDAIKAAGLPVLLVGMKAPRNLGPDYVREYEAVFPDLASKYDTLYYPFFLEGVALDPTLNQGDGMHPNEKGVARIVKGILPVVEKLIALARAARAEAGPAMSPAHSASPMPPAATGRISPRRWPTGSAPVPASASSTSPRNWATTGQRAHLLARNHRDRKLGRRGRIRHRRDARRIFQRTRRGRHDRAVRTRPVPHARNHPRGSARRNAGTAVPRSAATVACRSRSYTAMPQSGDSRNHRRARRGKRRVPGGRAHRAAGRCAQIADRVTGGGLSGVLLSPGLGMVTGLTPGLRADRPATHHHRRARQRAVGDRPPSGARRVHRGHRSGTRGPAGRSGPPGAGGAARAGFGPGRLPRAQPHRDRSRQAPARHRRYHRHRPDADLLHAQPRHRQRRPEAHGRRPRPAASGPPRGGLYYLVRRARAQPVRPRRARNDAIHDALGDFPVAGFYANGEIFNHRLYGYTGVLVLFP